jgi:hypothetical protein
VGVLSPVDSPTVAEFEALFRSLTPSERDDLLQELLTAAPKGGDAVVAVLEVWLLDHSALRDA